ncbi:MAG TPA: transposase [Armatimonadota bacterium]|nr:transposase [Armatimonadota bacterium]
MLTPSVKIISLLSAFSYAMSRPTFEKAMTLLYGAILAPGRRTISAILRVMGLSHEKHHERYHHVFSRANWYCMSLSRILLSLLVKLFVPNAQGVEMVMDETLVRRWGKRILYKGIYRDGVRSTAKAPAFSPGIRWLCVCLLAKVPWCQRRWALPFLIVPVLSEKVCAKLHKRHRGAVEMAGECIRRIRRWLPDRPITVSADGEYAAVELLQVCRDQTPPVTLVCRSRLDMRLFDPPLAQQRCEDGSKRRGPEPKKGDRQTGLAARLKDGLLEWQTLTISWYGGVPKVLELLTGVSLWHRQGKDPVRVRWVLVRSVKDPKTQKTPKSFKPCVYLCTDETATVEEILGWVVERWNIEVTFEEMRAHMGLETHRNFSQRSIGRMVPCLFGAFSLVVAMAKTLHPKSLPVQKSAWYKKEEPTFVDALASVRSHLWNSMSNEIGDILPVTEDIPSATDAPDLDATIMDVPIVGATTGAEADCAGAGDGRAAFTNHTHSSINDDPHLIPMAAETRIRWIIGHFQNLLCYA